MSFRDRTDAGRQLAEQLALLRLTDVVVLAVPSGGVAVGFEVARALRAPLDVLVVRRLVSRSRQGVSFGAVAEGGLGYVEPDLLLSAGSSAPEFQAIAEAEFREVQRGVELWRGAWPPISVRDKVALLVDDLLETGNRARAAVLALRPRHARSILLAVPVAPMATIQELSSDIDGIVCLQPQDTTAVADAYDDFTPVTNEQVAILLERAQRWTAADESRDSV